jgi:hypothetical protein
VAESSSRLAKSLGVTTFFWMTEKKISINRPWGISTVMFGFGGSLESLQVALDAGDDA